MVDKTIPDVLGFKLEDALVLFEGLPARVEVELTRPFPDAVPQGDLRVVRAALTGDGNIKLIIASQEYLKGGVQKNGLQNH